MNTIKNPVTEDYSFQILDNVIKELSQYINAVVINRSGLAYTITIFLEFVRLRSHNQGIEFQVP